MRLEASEIWLRDKKDWKVIQEAHQNVREGTGPLGGGHLKPSAWRITTRMRHLYAILSSFDVSEHN